MDIQYNSGLETLAAITMVASYDHQKKEMAKTNRKIDPRITKFVNSVNENMSPMMKSDLMFYHDYCPIFEHVLWLHLVKNGRLNFQEGLSFIKTLDYESMIRLFMSDDESAIDVVESDLLEELKEDDETKDNNKHSVEGFLEYKKYPDEMLERYLRFANRFYNDYYLPIEQEISEILEKKIKKHQKIKEEHIDKYLKGVALIKLDEVKSGETKFQPIVSYFLQTSIVLKYDYDENILYSVYGYKAESRFDPKYIAKRRRDLFKSLSDETRMKIINALKTGPKYTTELADLIGVSKATISYHMNRLVILDIVKICVESSGKKVHYELDIDELEKYFIGFLDQLRS